jgi:hypothetical protein
VALVNPHDVLMSPPSIVDRVCKYIDRMIHSHNEFIQHDSNIYLFWQSVSFNCLRAEATSLIFSINLFYLPDRRVLVIEGPGYDT